jgi:hypothetical protein
LKRHSKGLFKHYALFTCRKLQRRTASRPLEPWKTVGELANRCKIVLKGIDLSPEVRPRLEDKPSFKARLVRYVPLLTRDT